MLSSPNVMDTVPVWPDELISPVNSYLSRSSSINRGSSELKGEYYTSSKSNEDVKILLKCTSPLLWSQNSAVLLAAAGVHWIMAPMEDVKRIIKPLLFVLRSSSASKYVVIIIIPFKLFFPHVAGMWIFSLFHM